MFKKLGTATLSAALLLVLTACTPSSGYVMDKDHNPAHYEQEQYCAMYDTKNPGLCKIYQYRDRWVDDAYSLKIKNYEEDKEGWKGVTKETFDSYSVGDFIDFDRK